MKVAIIRGPYLNKYEMQNYEPLLKYFDLKSFYCEEMWKAVGIESINIPKKKLYSFEGILGVRLSKLLKYPFGLVGYRHHMIGLEKELKDFDILHTAETYPAYSYQAIKAKRKYKNKVVVQRGNIKIRLLLLVGRTYPFLMKHQT